MKKLVLIILMMGLVTAAGWSQNHIVLKARVIDGDTLPSVNLKEITIYSLKYPSSRRGQRRLTRLIRNVKKVYPYAKLAGIKLRQYDILLRQAKTEREKKRLMKKVEREINEEYGDELKELTFTQGEILLKLIDRETGQTSYHLVQELRGNFSAFFYQAFARLWGYNLKVRYDPLGEDRQIETIVRMIELGQL